MEAVPSALVPQRASDQTAPGLIEAPCIDVRKLSSATISSNMPSGDAKAITKFVPAIWL
jgi:hypothetical protein